ncbi:MAG: PQQ-binding-like beta-propeller repeat protein, partial [Planctomycetaceae bacterium]
VQLVVLEPGARGVTVAWSQALYNPTANLSNPAVGIERRLAGLTPSVSGDVVICPTGETTIVAVDRRRRALLWAHEYRRPSYDAPQQALAIRMLMNQQQSRGRIEDQLMDQLLQSDHWQDAAAVIAGEYVLCTPPDSQELLCLGLLDGKPVWRQPRGERQFIATVDQSRVVIVGQEQVEALQLESGAPAWNGVLPIPPPAGRGFRHGRLYALPLATGEVATMDLETGRLVARTPLPPESGRGNLLSADGRIVCQTADSVFGMQPLDQLTRDVESQLAAQPNDAAALMRRGEIHVHLGEEAPGLDDLRRAIVVDPKSPAGRLLATILIEGLRTNFDAYRGRAAEIEQLVTAPADQTLFHRLYAAGLQRRGEVAAALQQYLKYADTVSDDGGLLRVDGARQVRSPQWIAGRLDELLESAGTEERGRLQSELAKKVEDALANESTQRLAVLRQVIPEPRERRRIDQQLAATAETSELQSELLLLELLKSPDPQESAVATARLAERWLATGRRSDLLHQLLARLGGPLSAQACLNGRTGGELLTAWRADPPRAALIDAPDPWPTTHVNVKEHVRNLPTMTYAVRQLGPRSELLRGWTFVTDPGGTKLMACDEWGRQLWQVPTGRTGVLPGRQGPNYVRYISTYGRLLLLVAADQWTLLDAISLGDAPTVLAAERLVADGDGRQFIPNMPRGGQPIRNRNRPWIDPQSGSVPMGNVGPIAGGMFVYQAGSQLTAIDVATGRPVWTHDRPELTPGGDILADERTVIVWPPDSTDLQMFRAVDGSALGNARLPAHRELPQPEGIWGTGIVTTERGIDGRTLTLGMFDPVQQQQIWRRETVDVADWGVVDGHDFYVLQKDQWLRIIDGESGAIQAELQLPADGKATQAAVWSDSQRWYVATYRETEERQFPRSSQVTIVNGVVAAAARGSGELVWTVPVQRQLLHRDIPGGWPFLVLGTWSAPPGRTANERTATSTCTALLLEKSSGRILMETTAPGRDSSLGWQSEPAQHTIHLSVGSIKSTIEFGEPPAPKDPPESK